jgi:stage II sporulation protein R
MKKAILFVCLSLFLSGLCFTLECSAEKVQLRENIIRLHVVANSDSAADQAQKLRVRDAIIDYLSQILADTRTAGQAEAVISANISHLQSVAEAQLRKENSSYKVAVRLSEESFDIRHYDTFSLPSGVYTSLRIEIGDAEGKNWWCVAFPSLCMPASSEEFSEVAADAGFSDQLTQSISRNDKIEIRFFFLDFLGNLENFLHNR